MDYKVKLQNNNNIFRDNNVDLQTILDAVNNLPTATPAINLDTEIADQDAVIAQIQTALEGKAANSGGVEVPLVPVTYESAFSVNMRYFTIVDNTIQEVTINNILDGESGTIQVAKNTSIYIESNDVGTGIFDSYFPPLSFAYITIDNLDKYLLTLPGDEYCGYTVPVTSNAHLVIADIT